MSDLFEGTNINNFKEEVETNFYDPDYSFEWHNHNSTLTMIPREKLMPTIVCNVDKEDNEYYFNVYMTFPTLRYEDMEFCDSYEYWTCRWACVGKLVTYISKYKYRP